MGKAIFNGRERRSYVRIDTELPVRFRIYGSDPGKIYSGKTQNVSQGGLCVAVVQDQDELIETLSSLEQLPTVEVELSLPDLYGEPNTPADWIASRLDWARKPNAGHPTLLMGLGFVYMHTEVRRQIYEFVLSHFLKNYHPQQRVRPPVYVTR
jgi:hypothetical protein